MALTFSRQITSIATALALALFLGQAVSQNLDCPNGIISILAATGQIAHPGSSESTYGVNETKCWKIQIPDVYEGIGFYYHKFDIEQCDKCECDSLTFSYNATDWGPSGKWLVEKECGRQTSSYLEFVRFADGDPNKKIRNQKEVYVRFASDESVSLRGFNMTFIAKIDSTDPQSFLNASENEVIEFATRKFGIKNYPADYEEEWFLIVPKGRQVQITFEAFELEQSEKCENAFVEIREAYFDDGPYRDEIEAEYGVIIAEHLCGNSLPHKIQSTGNMAWVKFKSAKNSATTYKGFKASFKAVGGPNNEEGQGGQQGKGGKQGECCDCKCARSGQERLSTTFPLVLVFISALLGVTWKE